MFKVAVVQKAPVFLDREGALNKAVSAINEAASRGAKLIVFPEVFIQGTRLGFGGSGLGQITPLQPHFTNNY